jgi:hypothetical protein
MAGDLGSTKELLEKRRAFGSCSRRKRYGKIGKSASINRLTRLNAFLEMVPRFSAGFA